MSVYMLKSSFQTGSHVISYSDFQAANTGLIEGCLDSRLTRGQLSRAENKRPGQG